jgi:hypothetical protein
MDWKEYIVPIQIKKDGNCISCKMIIQFPTNDNAYLGNFVKGLFGSNVVVDFEGIKSKERYLKEEKVWKDYSAWLYSLGDRLNYEYD